jgi:hypothetical protein
MDQREKTGQGGKKKKNPGGGDIFCSRPDRPWGPPSLLYNGYRFCFPGVKRPGRGADHPPSSSAEVKERVQLYLYSHSGSSWPVLGWPLPLPGFKWLWLGCYEHDYEQSYSINFGKFLGPLNDYQFLTYDIRCDVWITVKKYWSWSTADRIA